LTLSDVSYKIYSNYIEITQVLPPGITLHYKRSDFIPLGLRRYETPYAFLFA